MHEQCVPGSFSSFPTQEPGNEAVLLIIYLCLLRLRAISTLGQYILKGGICLMVVSVQGLNLFNAVIIQGGICSRAGSTQGWYRFKG